MVGKPFEIRNNPQTDAQFSIPYTVITALLNGDVFLGDFEEDNIRNQRIVDLTKLVEVIPDNKIEAKDMMECTLEVRTREGQVFRSSTSAAKGNPLNPMSMDECIGKFQKCLAYGPIPISGDKIAGILNMLERFEDIEDISHFTALLS